jgi:hypothetical protein
MALAEALQGFRGSLNGAGGQASDIHHMASATAESGCAMEHHVFPLNPAHGGLKLLPAIPE